MSQLHSKCFPLRKCIHKVANVRCQNTWTSKTIRQSFIDFFKDAHGHRFVPSSSVIPKKDEGTYFTNAGMNQFKPLLLGTEPPGSLMSTYKRAVNSQKCIRVGGQHNDLDDVGNDLSHHTFFEMLGNWSFGDYGKKKACSMALELITDVFKLPINRLYFTYFNGDTSLGLNADTETKEVWLELGIPENRILPFGMKDNFWAMGKDGPCGPCTEIHYDHGINRCGGSLVNADSPDVVEIWNLVFIQFNRDGHGKLQNLPKHHIDTGMGLERINAVLQGTKSNYQTDLFTPLMSTIQKVSKAPPYSDSVGVLDTGGVDTAYRILSDHARMITVAISDGLLPDRAGLGHKLRQIMNRAIHQSVEVFGCDKTLLFKLVDDVSLSLGEVYPEIPKHVKLIKDVVEVIDENYKITKENSQKAWDKMMNQNNNNNDLHTLTGAMIQDLHDGRYGFSVPLDFISYLAKERNLGINSAEFQSLVDEKQGDSGPNPSVLSMTGKGQLLSLDQIEELQTENINTDDSFKYSYLSDKGTYTFENLLNSTLKKIISEGRFTEKLERGEKGYLILDKTLFYSESGGQASDRGKIFAKSGIADVNDVQCFKGYVLHEVVITDGFLSVIDDSAELSLDTERRLNNMRNHTATHLLNSALRKVLDNTQQRGSDIQPHKFHFDISFFGNLDQTNVEIIESSVKQSIKDCQPVELYSLPLSEALNLPNIVSIPNEVYPDVVRVVSIENSHSAELCGGTHVHNTGDISNFSIIKLSGVSQATKRLTCVTGDQALKAEMNQNKLITTFQSLENNVKNLKESDTWNLYLKEIYTTLKLELIPKVTRDLYQAKTEQLQTSIRTELNKQITNKVKQDLDKVLSISEELNTITTSIQTDDTKIITRILNSVEISKPLMLISDKNQKASLITVCVPHQCQMTNLMTNLKRGGFKCKITEKVLKGQNKFVCFVVINKLESENNINEMKNKISDILSDVS